MSLKQLIMPAVTSSAVLGIIGLLGMWSGIPWLFPSLGPTVAIQTTSPNAPGARPWNVLAGHLIGMASGFASVYITGAIDTSSVIAAQMLSSPRLVAAVLAVLMSMLVQRALKAQHPPAEATTLLIALGALPATPRGALTIAIGVVLVTVFGQLAKRMDKVKAE